jgi:hypothetical protein
MKAMLIVVMKFRYRAAPNPKAVGDQTAQPFWTWFVENPRASSG